MTLQSQAVEAATQPWLQLGPLLYVLVGGALTLIGTALGLIGTWRLDLQRERRRLNAERAHFAGAVAAELEGLFRRYMQVAGDRLGQAQQPADLPGGLLPRFNYFAVFDANLSKIGLLRPDDATRLVATYILAKGHMDDLITWGQFVLPRVDLVAAQNFLANLKRDHDELVQSVPQVVTLLRRYASSAEQR